MDKERLRELLAAVQGGSLEIDAALGKLATLPFADLGYARVDHHRALRSGIAEVVLAEGKAPEHLIGIVQRLLVAGDNVLVTRLAGRGADELLQALPQLSYSKLARTAKLVQRPIAEREGAPVAVVTAGTSDIPVAEEAFETLAMFGLPAKRYFDVGVAGIHRLMAELDALCAAPAVIVVAGMEGALPSVVGGLIGAPIVAVPTSVGYGTALSGFTALFGMLTSCASGITVVNIDNGFGAAMAVGRILSLKSTMERR
ncbi:MAG TPA: nickel pincer cofactor biosynthesis protein LarB [Polyangiaceae bacterium]|nr:nickel pincer cofactor biosynthesis protein LarB [Polyangiaceae bacterium]